MWDQLEQRRLLSVSATFDGTTVSVVGTDKPERIDVTIEHAWVRQEPPTLDRPTAFASASTERAALATSRRAVELVESAVVTVLENDTPVRRWTLPLSVIRAVHLDGAGGDDALTVYNYATPVESTVFAGEGRDEITVTNSMGASGSTVLGGLGDDVIRLIATRGAFAGHAAFGEEGDDLIFGSLNDDSIWGDDDGAPDVVRPQGSDTVFADGGNDHIFGGGDADELHGDDGDDRLDGGAGADYVDGNAGHDTAAFDSDDTYVRIEEMVILH